MRPFLKSKAGYETLNLQLVNGGQDDLIVLLQVQK
jgi:hypothetical protein